MRCSRASVVPMSRRSGTLSRVSVSAVSRPAHRMGSAAFLAPEITTSPSSAVPPSMRSLSIQGGLVFGRRQGAHRQGMDLGLHAVAQRAIDRLVARQRALALEGAADDQGLEVCAVPVDFEVVAVEVLGD